MPRRSWLLASLALVVAAMACGHSSESASTGTKEVRVNLADSGRSITLDVDDRLSVSLGSSSDRHWVIGGFPRAVLSPPVTNEPGGFTFTALGQGRGHLAIINTFACPSAMAHECSVPEPGNTSTGSGPGVGLPRVFTLTVRVA